MKRLVGALVAVALLVGAPGAWWLHRKTEVAELRFLHRALFVEDFAGRGRLPVPMVERYLDGGRVPPEGPERRALATTLATERFGADWEERTPVPSEGLGGGYFAPAERPDQRAVKALASACSALAREAATRGELGSAARLAIAPFSAARQFVRAAEERGGLSDAGARVVFWIARQGARDLLWVVTEGERRGSRFRDPELLERLEEAEAFVRVTRTALRWELERVPRFLEWIDHYEAAGGELSAEFPMTGPPVLAVYDPDLGPFDVAAARSVARGLLPDSEVLGGDYGTARQAVVEWLPRVRAAAAEVPPGLPSPSGSTEEITRALVLRNSPDWLRLYAREVSCRAEIRGAATALRLLAAREDSGRYPDSLEALPGPAAMRSDPRTGKSLGYEPTGAVPRLWYRDLARARQDLLPATGEASPGRGRKAGGAG